MDNKNKLLILHELEKELELLKMDYRCNPDKFNDMAYATTVGVVECILSRYGVGVDADANLSSLEGVEK